MTTRRITPTRRPERDGWTWAKDRTRPPSPLQRARALLAKIGRKERKA